MTPYIADPDFQLFVGDALDVLAGMPDESVDCAATSPPFFGLRDYGMDGQIGLEESPDEWAEKLVGVFAEVRRVLKPTGTLWVECGDSYASGPSGGLGGSTLGGGQRNQAASNRNGKRGYGDAKPKDLLGQPWLLAFALRADGWWLRQAIIWHKPNCMPESATDRCTTAHSYVFLLSKSARYHFDAEAISEPAEWARWGDQTVPKYEGTDTASGWMQSKTKGELRALRTESGSWESGGLEVGKSSWPDGRKTGYTIADQEPPQDENLLHEIKTKKPDGRATHEGGHGSFHRDGREKGETAYVNQRPDVKKVEGVGERGFERQRADRADGRKNPRSVWTIPTQGFSEAHFATWPEALVERILKAGCPEDGTVLDPFMGSGTTALVARKLGRKSIGIELNAEYAEMCARRLGQQSLLAEGAV